MMSSNQQPHILLVDDKSENLMILEHLLKKVNANLIKAHSGNEALEMALKYEFAVILMDVQMPDMDGFETAEVLRSHIHTPIIFITAYRKEDQYVFKGYESGAVDYLFKPIDAHILQSKVNVFIDFYLQQKKLNRFVEMVSHDLKGPLTSLSALSQTLLENPSHANLSSIAEAMCSTSQRAFQLVNDLLDIAALEQGKLSPQFQSFPLDFLIEPILQEYQPALKSKGVEASVVTEGVKVSADFGMIQQVLSNLIDNAIKFTPTHGKIHISTLIQGDHVLVKVEDTGIGIDEETIPHLLAKDHKHSTQGTEGEKGTGFGLALCQELLKAHQSELNIQSTPGKGSLLSFKLSVSSSKQA